VKIRIAAVGQRQPDWADAAVADYLARFPKDFAVELVEVKAEARQGATADRLLAAESARLRAALSRDGHLVALDERGEDWTTRQFAQALGKWRDEAQDVQFIIGGPDGIDPTLLADARLRLRLSSMTLPHALARVLLVEQIYRAWSLLNHHPYHRA
jgi:23S rRNA (pseudouridine1915-N3)-methyltransferase